MTPPRRFSQAVLTAAVALLTLAPAALAQQTPATSTPPPPPTSGSDRFFLNFFEDATLIDGQWWEGQFQLLDGDHLDTTLVRGVAAVKITDPVEVGGSVGFGTTDSDGTIPDGTGATDLDLYGKYYFGPASETTEFAAGLLLTVPTGDDNAGLGTDAFSLGGFGSIRWRLKPLILGGNLGFNINGDAQFSGGPEQDGKFSWFGGLGVIVPLSDRLGFVGEARFETERYDGGDDSSQALAGLNLRISGRGQFRAAVAAGLTDAAPDWQLTLGYAHTF